VLVDDLLARGNLELKSIELLLPLEDQSLASLELLFRLSDPTLMDLNATCFGFSFLSQPRKLEFYDLKTM
jgi:hypothetical protein